MFPVYFPYIKGSDINFNELINVALARKILTLCLHDYEMGNILIFMQKTGEIRTKEILLKIIF